jgi:hypothetical protein
MSRPVVFLAHSYPPENIVGARRPYRFAKYLSRFGYTPYIITASAQPLAAEHIRQVPDRYGVAEKVVNRGLVFEEGFSWAKLAAREAEALLREIPAKLVFSTSPPFGAHIAARRLAQRLAVKWVADFRDPMQGNDARLRLPIRIVDKVFEPRFFRAADILIANTQAAAQLLELRCPQYKNKIRFIYNGFDPETPGLSALPIPPRPFRVLTHAGSLYRVSMTLALLDTLSAAIEQGSVDSRSVRLRMLGEIEGFRALSAAPGFERLQRAGVLECTPHHAPEAEARRAMAESDSLVAVDRYRAGGIIQLPAKTFEYIQIGRPILAVTGRGSPMEYALRTSGVLHTCLYPEQDAPAEMVTKLVEFLQFPTDARPMSAAYVEEFGALGQTARLARLFDELLGAGIG